MYFLSKSRCKHPVLLVQLAGTVSKHDLCYDHLKASEENESHMFDRVHDPQRSHHTCLKPYPTTRVHCIAGSISDTVLCGFATGNDLICTHVHVNYYIHVSYFWAFEALSLQCSATKYVNSGPASTVQVTHGWWRGHLTSYTCLEANKARPQSALYFRRGRCMWLAHSHEPW